MQGCSCILIILQDYSREVFLLNSQNERHISKMKKQRNHYQLKEQENSSEGTNNKTALFSLIDTEFKKELLKILKELRKAITEMQITVKWNQKL